MQKILRSVREKFRELTGYAVIKLPSGLSLDANFLAFKNFFKLIRNVKGNIVECGVGYGKSFLIITQLARLEGKGRKIWGFDSFEGFPEPNIHDKSTRIPKKGDWGETSKKRILNYLIQNGKVEPSYIKKYIRLVKGFFNESLVKYDHNPIALLHLDCDLYESYKICLEYLWPKVAKGGIVLFDEYKAPSAIKDFPGASKAIDEYFGELKIRIKLNEFANKYYIFKR